MSPETAASILRDLVALDRFAWSLRYCADRSPREVVVQAVRRCEDVGALRELVNVCRLRRLPARRLTRGAEFVLSGWRCGKLQKERRALRSALSLRALVVLVEGTALLESP